MSYCSVHIENSAATLGLKGDWTVFALPRIQAELENRKLEDLRKVIFDGGALKNFDTSGAWYLNDLILHLKDSGVAVELQHFSDDDQKLFKMIAALPHEKGDRRKGRRTHRLHLSRVYRHTVGGFGKYMAEVWEDAVRGITYFGHFLVKLFANLPQPRHLRLQSVVFHINEIGLKAIPIISLMTFSIAFVTGYQGAFQLQKFDATVYTIDLVVLSMLREMGVLITAIMVAGRSGSSFAAQLGAMKLNEEVDALRTMDTSPFEVLVLPRLIAIIIALPLLTIVGDTAGLFGGYVFAATYMDYGFTQFLTRAQEATEIKQFYIGVSKAPVFAILIGIVGCMQGLQARGSAEDVGRRTITAVVQSIFLVIVADAIFSVIFTKLGI